MAIYTAIYNSMHAMGNSDTMESKPNFNPSLNAVIIKKIKLLITEECKLQNPYDINTNKESEMFPKI